MTTLDRQSIDDAHGRLASLASAARALSAARTLEEVVDQAAEEALFAFDASSASLGRLERESGLVRILVNAGDLGDGEEEHPLDETYRVVDFPLLSAMVDEARPWTLRIDDGGADTAEADLLRRLGKTSAISAPVLTEGRVWGELFITRDAGRPPFGPQDVDFALAFAGLVSAGIAQVEHLERVARLAYEDPLTGLANRRAVEERLEAALARASVTRAPVAVLMTDVNRLKAANDRFGHAAGDSALVAVASALSAAAGRLPGTVAGRLGGDEFCVVLDGHGVDAAVAMAREFLVLAADAPYGVGVACGVATTEGLTEEVTAQQLFAWADEAQYDAKRVHATEPVVAGHGAGHDRRRWRGRREAADALARALAVVADRGDEPVDVRTAAMMAALATDVEAVGWVLSLRRGGAATPVATGARRDGVRGDASVPAPASAAWVVAASATGVVVDDANVDVPLASIRGCSVVTAAIAHDWMAELLLDDPGTAADLAPVLRAALAVAVLG